MRRTSESITAADPDTVLSLRALEEREHLLRNRVPGVRTVSVVLSSKAMVFDVEALRQRISMAYPEAAVFFRATSGKAIGVQSPQKVDLLIDLTGPGQRQGFFYARALRRVAKVAVGRNAGFFRKKIYDRVFDEKAHASELPRDLFDRERVVQRAVLAMAGVAMIPAADATPDYAKEIALRLPPLAHG